MDTHEHIEDGRTVEAVMIDEHTDPKAANIEQVKDQPRHRSSKFKSRPPLLLDIESEQPDNPVEAKHAGGAGESSEELLQQLLVNTETAAQRTQSAKDKWQLTALVLTMLLVSAIVVIAWLSFGVSSAGSLKGRLQVESQSLKEKLNTANVQITGMKGEIEKMREQVQNVE